MNIRPIAANVGHTGFFAMEAIDKADQYQYTQVGRYHNYYFKPDHIRWPVTYDTYQPSPTIIDGFSPNLNKSLHIGHLRQLALANALQRIIPFSRFYALLGTTLGVLPHSVEEWVRWRDYVGYRPVVCYDTSFTPHVPFIDGIGEYEGCKLWRGPKGSVVAIRSDGRPTYSYHEMGFAEVVAPTHYITGMEQRDHFEALGLQDKHFVMGLVLGTDGKKLKSRTEDAFTARETEQLVKDKLKVDDGRLSWNVMAWNFLHVAREKNVKFDLEQWTQSDAPGLYITYTLARLCSAFREIELPKEVEWTERDIHIAGWAAYKDHYLIRAVDTFDPAPLANYAHDLARVIGNAYNAERIRDGRPAFQRAMWLAYLSLVDCVEKLGMFAIFEV